jgi:histidyl-tRNA synthetase
MFPNKDEITPTNNYYTMYDYNGPFSNSINVANHYGFHLVKPLDASSVTHDDEEYFHTSYKNTCGERAVELTKFGPDLVCHTQNPRKKIGSLMLEAHGCNKSIAEGIVLKTGLSILKDLGEKNLEIELNCLGDTDTQAKFKKHYVEFVKKHLSKIPDEYQAEVRENPFFASKLSMRDDNLKAIFTDSPVPLNYLCDHDRRHLMEVIEYIESMNISYKLNPLLLGYDGSPSHSFFRIVRGQAQKKTRKQTSQPSLKTKTVSIEESPQILASGERFEYRENKALPRQHIVSLSIKLPAGKHESYREKKKEDTPQLYFVHIGPEAKKRGFMVLDVLRETKMPVKQYLIRDSLTDQMLSAEAAQPSHLLIMGMKEAHENSVIVRNTQTRAQAVVEIPHLRSYLKNIVK